jgi:hypothetical protein
MRLRRFLITEPIKTSTVVRKTTGSIQNHGKIASGHLTRPAVPLLTGRISAIERELTDVRDVRVDGCDDG